jgi:hypothetical protein
VKELALRYISAAEVVELLDTQLLFELLNIPYPNPEPVSLKN